MKPDTNESQKPAAGTTKLIRGLRNMLKWGTGPRGGGGTLDDFSQGRQEAEGRMRKELRRLLKEETPSESVSPQAPTGGGSHPAACSAVIDELIAIEEGAEWEVFITENMTKEGKWERPGGRTPLWYLKYGFRIRRKLTNMKPMPTPQAEDHKHRAGCGSADAACYAEGTESAESRTDCCGMPFYAPGWPDGDLCTGCREHAVPEDYEPHSDQSAAGPEPKTLSK